MAAWWWLGLGLGLLVAPGVALPDLRFNFASAEMGAKVLAANPESKGAARLLQADRDKYFLNPCSAARKWVTIELSDETRITTFAMVNYEYYAFSPRNFTLLGATQYPCSPDRGCLWQLLGNFCAENHQSMQYFVVPRPTVVRYLKLLFLSFYGKGPYCTVSKVRVYGSNFFEDFHSAPDDAPARSALVSLQHLGEEEEEPGRPPGPTRAEPASADSDQQLTALLASLLSQDAPDGAPPPAPAASPGDAVQQLLAALHPPAEAAEGGGPPAVVAVAPIPEPPLPHPPASPPPTPAPAPPPPSTAAPAPAPGRDPPPVPPAPAPTPAAAGPPRQPLGGPPPSGWIPVPRRPRPPPPAGPTPRPGPGLTVRRARPSASRPSHSASQPSAGETAPTPPQDRLTLAPLWALPVACHSGGGAAPRLAPLVVGPRPPPHPTSLAPAPWPPGTRRSTKRALAKSAIARLPLTTSGYWVASDDAHPDDSAWIPSRWRNASVCPLSGGHRRPERVISTRRHGQCPVRPPNTSATFDRLAARRHLRPAPPQPQCRPEDRPAPPPAPAPPAMPPPTAPRIASEAAVAVVAAGEPRGPPAESSTAAGGLGSGKLDVLRSMAHRIKALEQYDRDSTALFTELRGKHGGLKRSHRELAQDVARLKEVLARALQHVLAHAPGAAGNATELRWALDQLDRLAFRVEHLHQLLRDQKHLAETQGHQLRALTLQLDAVQQQSWVQFVAGLFLSMFFCFSLLRCLGPPDNDALLQRSSSGRRLSELLFHPRPASIPIAARWLGDLSSPTDAGADIDTVSFVSRALAQRLAAGAALGAVGEGPVPPSEGSDFPPPGSLGDGLDDVEAEKRSSPDDDYDSASLFSDAQSDPK